VRVRSRLDHNEIPRGWAQKRFGDFASLQRGYDLPAAHRVPGDVPVIGSNGVVGNHNQSMVTGPGVLTGRSGTMGLSHYVDRDFWPLNTALFVTDFHSNFPLFAHYFFSFFDFGRFAAGASVPTLNRNLVHDASIFVPPLIEQQAIAGVLSKVQSAVEVQEKIVAGLRELKAATMAKLFREGLRGERRKQTEIGEIPKSWDVVRLGDVARIERGKFSHRPRNDPRFYGGDLPFIQTGDVTKCNGRIRTHTQTLNAEGLAVSKLFPRGTIVLTIAANIGDTGILEFDSCFPDSLVGIMPGAAMDAVVLEQFLRTQKPEMDRLAPKGTQKNITIEFLKPWLVVRPGIGEQRDIASALRCVDDSMETALRRLEALRTLFSSTLHLLMTGQVRVPVSKGA
jgi:type I restriction enzyme, S subunit